MGNLWQDLRYAVRKVAVSIGVSRSGVHPTTRRLRRSRVVLPIPLYHLYHSTIILPSRLGVATESSR
jgi:hypothetical protein